MLTRVLALLFLLLANTIGAAAQVTTIVLHNFGSSTQSAPFVTPMFGMMFHKGDIPNGCIGRAPQFIIQGQTTPLGFSESVQPHCWNDGSLKAAAFMLLDTTAVGAGTSSAQTINVFSGGSAPATSSRSPNDFNPASVGGGNCDINNQVVGLDNLSGSWEADLWNGYEMNGADYKYMDGMAGAVWRIRASYRQSGAAHGQLEDWYYAASLQDPRGRYYGMRWLGRTTMPYYNNNSSPHALQFASFASYKDYDRSTQLADLWSGHGNAIGFDWSGTGNCQNNLCLTTGSGSMNWEYGNLIRVTTTGGATPPTGLFTGTSYFVDNGPASPYQMQKFLLFQNSAIAGSGVAITGYCSLSFRCFATSYPYVTAFGSLFDAGGGIGVPAGMPYWNYRQCGGSGPSSDATIQIFENNIYARKSMLIPPYAFTNFINGITLSPTDTSSYGYFPMTAGPVERYLETTGERKDIGPFTGWASTYFFNVGKPFDNDGLTDERVIRIVGLAPANWPINLRDYSTKSLPCLNNGENNASSPYPGMPACMYYRFRWDATTSDSGFTNSNCGHCTLPENSNVWLAGYSIWNSSHAPDFEMPAFLVTGEPQYMDMIEELGDWALYQRASGGTSPSAAVVNSTTEQLAPCTGGCSESKNFYVNGMYYYGATLNGHNELRVDAWAHRFVAEAAMINDPENSSYHRYFQDVEAAYSGAALGFLDMFSTVNPYVARYGIWNEGESPLVAWTLDYMIGATAQGYAYAENSNDLIFLDKLVLMPEHIDAIAGQAYSAPYSIMVRPAPNAVTTQYLANDTGLAYASFNISWKANSTTFSCYQNACLGGWHGYTPNAGDTILFCANSACGTVAPSGLTLEAYYIMFNPKGYTFNLGLMGANCTQAVQTACIAVTPGNSASAQAAFFYSSRIPANESITSGVGGDGTGYVAIAYGNLEYACAVEMVVNGSTAVTSQILSDLQGIIAKDPNLPAGYNLDPKYALQCGF